MESKRSQWSERAWFITQLQPLTAAAAAVPLPATFQHLVHKALGANCLTAQTRPSGCNRREHFAPLLRQIADYPSSEIEPGPSATDAAGTEMIRGKKSSVPVSWESPVTARTRRTVYPIGIKWIVWNYCIMLATWAELVASWPITSTAITDTATTITDNNK